MINLLRWTRQCYAWTARQQETPGRPSFTQLDRLIAAVLAPLQEFEHASSFGAGDIIVHRKDPDTPYRILMDPRCGLTLEETDEPAYSYVPLNPDKPAKIWTRRASEVEDGRFTKVAAARKEDPWPELPKTKPAKN